MHFFKNLFPCLIVFILALFMSACISTTTTPDGTKEVKTFGAATVTVDPEGGVETNSAGVSEGFVSFLKAIPEAALRFVGAVGQGFANATPDDGEDDTNS